MVFDDEDQKSFLDDGTVSGGNSATYYSYDIHGNVDTLLQDYNLGMGDIVCDTIERNRFKKMVYYYDLISGKVNDVAYQHKESDQFYHRYFYDAENRITSVKTSKDKIYWEQDAEYKYYRHGPLSRTVLGQNQVQGLDYAYTIQGWLKGVNSTSVDTALFDMGLDGNVLSPHSQNARDAFGFSLNYFSGDYKPINTSVTPFATVPMSLPADPVSGISTAHQLFNGNIGAMVVNISKFNKPMVYGYRYDQLNRIVSMDAFDGLDNADNTLTANRLDDYHEAVTYDPNGNIRTYLRNGTTAGSSPLGMDDLGYTYITNTNKLKRVTDAVSAGNYTVDIDNQSETENYVYDKIGNLVEDKAEGIDSILWTVYGKIKRIVKGGTVIDYTYDAAGNRISKAVTVSSVTKSTYYVRDASGNVMSIYQAGDNELNSGELTQTEVHLYGSSRLGIFNVNNNVQCAPDSTDLTIFTRGNKFFELSNHLGNVLVTISDKLVPVPEIVCGFASCELYAHHYEPEVITANDYYPFGMMQPGRKYSNGSEYRYGFNGKEKDFEITSDDYDYGARIYDGKIGRWLSVDPFQKKYVSLTPYNFVANTPLQAKDPDGNLIIFINGFWGAGTGAYSGGNKEYWSYSNKKGGWADDAMQRVGDHHALFVDGSSGGLWKGNPQKQIFPSQRVLEGYNMGKKMASDIISSLKRDPNDPQKIVESVKFITNSMGAAYQRGMSAALTEYVDNYNNIIVPSHNLYEETMSKMDKNYKPNYLKPLQGFEIEFNVDIGAFQGNALPADKNSKTNQFMRSKDDIVAGYNDAKIPNATEIGINSNGDPKAKGHHASAYPTSDLPQSNKNGNKKEVNQNN